MRHVFWTVLAVHSSNTLHTRAEIKNDYMHDLRFPTSILSSGVSRQVLPVHNNKQYNYKCTSVQRLTYVQLSNEIT